MNAPAKVPSADEQRHDATVESVAEGYSSIARLITDSNAYHYSDQAVALAKVIARIDAERARLVICMETARELGEERAEAEWNARNGGERP